MKDIPPTEGEAAVHRGGRKALPFPVPHTQVHTLVRRTLENLEDMIVFLLMALLLLLSLQSLWRLARMALSGSAASSQLLSEVVFVLILTEVYRLLIFYLPFACSSAREIWRRLSICLLCLSICRESVFARSGVGAGAV